MDVEVFQGLLAVKGRQKGAGTRPGQTAGPQQQLWGLRRGTGRTPRSETPAPVFGTPRWPPFGNFGVRVRWHLSRRRTTGGHPEIVQSGGVTGGGAASRRDGKPDSEIYAKLKYIIRGLISRSKMKTPRTDAAVP